EHADGFGVGLQTSQGLGVVTSDLDHHVLTRSQASSFHGLFFHFRQTGGFAASFQNAIIENFASAVVGARNGDEDALVRQRLIDFGPVGVGVVDHFAIDRNLGGNSLVEVHGLEGEIALIDAGGEHDAVIAEHDFTHVFDAVGVAAFQLAG